MYIIIILKKDFSLIVFGFDFFFWREREDKVEFFLEMGVCVINLF